MGVSFDEPLGPNDGGFKLCRALSLFITHQKASETRSDVSLVNCGVPQRKKQFRCTIAGRSRFSLIGDKSERFNSTNMIHYIYNID